MDTFGQGAVPHQIADLQIFQRDRVMFAEQRERRLVVEIRSLAFHVLMRLGEQFYCLFAALAALLTEIGQKAPGLEPGDEWPPPACAILSPVRFCTGLLFGPGIPYRRAGQARQARTQWIATDVV
jgi:hypothetical protein